MNMFKNSTVKTVDEYIKNIKDLERKSEVFKLHKLIQEVVPKLEPFIISGMIGYGKYIYKSKSGRKGEWCIIALASQKNYISLYICAVDQNGYLAEQEKDKFPKASIGKSCIRFRKSEDLDLEELKRLIKKAEKCPMASV